MKYEKTKHQTNDLKEESPNVLNAPVESTEDDNCDKCVVNNETSIDWAVNVKTNTTKMSMKDRHELLVMVEKSVEKHLEENCDVPIDWVCSYWDDQESETELDVQDGVLQYDFEIRCKNSEDLPRLKKFLCKSSKKNQELKLTKTKGFPNLSKTLELLNATFENCRTTTMCNRVYSRPK